MRIALATLAAATAAFGSDLGSNWAQEPALQTDGTTFRIYTDDRGRQRVDIPYSFANRTGGPVYLVNCNGEFSVGLSRLVDDEWRSAWAYARQMCLSPPIVIEPGAVYRDTLRVVNAPEAALPRFDAVSGRYRFRWNDALSSYQDRLPFGEPLPLELRTSNEFEVVLDTASSDAAGVGQNAPGLPRPMDAGNPRGAWVAPNACPGEYCTLGEWQLTEDMILRREPAVGSDSVGFVPALAPFCADSAIVVVDPPGVLVVSRPRAEEPFAVGETVLILDNLGEGEWNVLWRDSVMPAFQYWAYDEGADQLKEPGASRWWVHVRYEPAGAAGWILRREMFASPGMYERFETNRGTLIDGGSMADDRWGMKNTPAC
jgi:hypothetical protein